MVIWHKMDYFEQLFITIWSFFKVKSEDRDKISKGEEKNIRDWRQKNINWRQKYKNWRQKYINWRQKYKYATKSLNLLETFSGLWSWRLLWNSGSETVCKIIVAWPGVTQGSPKVTQRSPWVTQGSHRGHPGSPRGHPGPWVTQGSLWVTLGSPRVTKGSPKGHAGVTWGCWGSPRSLRGHQGSLRCHPGSPGGRQAGLPKLPHTADFRTSLPKLPLATNFSPKLPYCLISAARGGQQLENWWFMSTWNSGLFRIDGR